MKIISHTEIGDHEENEDALAISTHAADESAIICALADGQGGRWGGAQAAQKAVAACLAKAQTFSPCKLLKTSACLEIGRQIDLEICASPDCGFTTFIAACVTPSHVVGVSSGDSAAVLVIDGKLVLLTQEQRKNPPVGSGAAQLTPFSAKLKGEWRFIMVSDGVWKYAGWEAFSKRCLSESSGSLISSLRNEAIDKNKILLDDFSIILIEP